VLSACGEGRGRSGGGGGGGPLKFWDQIWGSQAYIQAAKTLTEGYQPASGRPDATYQSIPWANFVQTYSSAIASNTGPAVSSGAGYQALQFFDQGAIAPADNLVSKLQGQDFLEGTIEPLKYQNQYVAVPWQLDIRALYYRKSLLEKAGAEIPTDWDSLKTACAALNKIGVSGFGMCAASST